MKIIASAPLPGSALARLAATHDVVVGPSESGLGRDALLDLAQMHRDTEGLVILLTDRIDAEVFDAFPSLRAVGNVAVGVDNIDLTEARRRKIAVCNTPDVLTDATADLAFGLLIATARRIAEGDRTLRTGGWGAWTPSFMLGKEVTGATLGIVGYGRIGRALGERARGFRMPLLAATRPGAQAPVKGVDGVRFASLDEVLASSDFVSIHCPLDDTTRGLIDARALARMKPDAILINTARGAIVDEAALAHALHTRTIAGAGLDVFVHEPSVHPALLTAPSTVLTPHIGSASMHARSEMARLACEGVAAVLAGRPAANRVA